MPSDQINVTEKLFEQATQISEMKGQIGSVETKVDNILLQFTQFVVEFKETKKLENQERKEWHSKIEKQIENIGAKSVEQADFNIYKAEVESRFSEIELCMETQLSPLQKDLKVREEQSQQLKGVQKLFYYGKIAFNWFAGIFMFVTSIGFLKYGNQILEFLSKLN